MICLLDSWETFRVSIRSSASKGVISLEVTKGFIINKGMIRNTHGSSYQYKILVNKNRWKKKEKKRGGRDTSRSESNGRYKNMECHYYHRTKNIQIRIILFGKRIIKERILSRNKEFLMMIVMIIVLLVMIMLFFITMHESIKFVSDERIWITDSGVTLNITSRRYFSTFYTSYDFRLLKMSNDGVPRIISVSDFFGKPT